MVRESTKRGEQEVVGSGLRNWVASRGGGECGQTIAGVRSDRRNGMIACGVRYDVVEVGAQALPPCLCTRSLSLWARFFFRGWMNKACASVGPLIGVACAGSTVAVIIHPPPPLSSHPPVEVQVDDSKLLHS